MCRYGLSARSGGLFIFVAAALLFTCRTALGLDWTFDPSIALTEKFDSNVLFRDHDEQSDFISILNPRLSIGGKGEDVRFRFDSDVTFEKYAEHEELGRDELDTIDYNIKSSMSRNWTERFLTDANIRLSKDTTLDTQLEEAGIRTIRTPRYRYDGDMKATYQLTERVSLAASGGGGYMSYPNGELPNSTSWQSGFTPAWQITEKDTLSVISNYSYNDYEESSTVKNLFAMLSWDRLLNEKTSFQIGAGYRYTWIDFFTWEYKFVPPGRFVLVKKLVETSDDGAVFMGMIKRDWSEQMSSTLSVGRDVYSSADGRTFERNYVRLGGTYRFSDVTIFGSDLYYYMNTQKGQGDEEVNYVRFAPSIERKLSERFSLRLVGSYENQLTETKGYESSPERYAGWLELRYTWPRFWASH